MKSERAAPPDIEGLRESPEYVAYRRVLTRVFELRDLEADGPAGRPSEYWREELANFDYMLDASPLIIRKLRHHTFHVTGLRLYDYRTHKDEAKRRFAAKLDALVAAAGSRDLLVPESPILGGFGYEIDARLYNVDTLKYFEALIALDRGGALAGLRASGERRLVWEIGAGWGGFAYQMRTLFPRTTYVIVDFPELFLFSAVYLMTAFPDATVRIYGDVPEAELFRGWEGLDFVFLPASRLGALRPPRLDLTVNLVSFQEMTTEQVRAYVRKAHELASPWLYSLNRDRSLYNRELTSVRSVIGELYEPEEVRVLDVSYNELELPRRGGTSLVGLRRLLRRAAGAAAAPARKKEDLGYRHVVARRRAGPDR